MSLNDSALMTALAAPAVQTGLSVAPAVATGLPSPGQQAAVWAVFALVYLGMFLGRLPLLKLDRTGVAVLGAIAMVALTGMPIEEAARAVDLPTMVLLLAFMVVSAQLRQGGFYAAVGAAVGRLPWQRGALLGVLVAVVAALSAVFSNDVICLALTPLVLQMSLQRRLDPVPFLLALACAANIGSAATLIGNPQNMLIGSVLQLSFAGYTTAALWPVVGSLVVLWLWLAYGPGSRPGADPWFHALPGSVTGGSFASVAHPAWDRWPSAKGLLVAAALMAVFLLTDWPREVAALVGAAVLLVSRRRPSSALLAEVDWPLLLLFVGLFVVNHALAATGLARDAVSLLRQQGVLLHEPTTLLVLGALLSNLVSNVPAVMLLLPHIAGADADTTRRAGQVLALATTFAGNLLLVGSIANLIVADLAKKAGITLDWRHHARVGLPVTLASLLILAAALR
jgi:Na+/H+ antiporter NhaD/arsenite permease-like protein